MPTSPCKTSPCETQPSVQSHAVLLWGVLLILIVLATPLAADDTPRWIRDPAISPDGTTIAFSWRGDLWTVPVDGGEATPLTSHAAYEAWPVWSPDSQRIAFASDRHGQLDVFLVDALGGTPTRLTFHSADDVPSDFTSDGARVFFESDRQHAPQALLGQGAFSELYSTSVDGAGRPRQEVTTPVLEANLSADDSRVVYEERTAYENEWRKHQVSSAARDVWTWNRQTGEHVKLTDFPGEDRDPLWSRAARADGAADGGDILYLSEEGGTFNVWKMSADGKAKEQVTRHGPHPVRFLSQADDGTLAYGYHGAVWVHRLGEGGTGGESREVPITLRADERANVVQRAVASDGATEMAVSPLGDEVAFVVRGDVFVASVEHGTTRRVTDTVEQERSVSWAPDGRSLYFASERGGSWNLYKTSLVHDDEERFFLSTETAEEPVLVTDAETFQPVVSPDGMSVAYLHDRDEIRWLDLASGESKTLVPAERNYSYSDGDISFVFSPDGHWLSATYLGHDRWIDEIGLVNLTTGEIHNVSDSGYSESAPAFSADGQTLFFVSDRYGQRSHGSWGAESDVMAVSLNRAAWDHAQLSLEEWQRQRKREREKEGEKEGEDERQDGDETKDLPDPVKVDPEDFDDRVRRMTFLSADLAAYVPSNDGEAVFFLASVDDEMAVWGSHARKGETRRLASLGGGDGGNGRGGGSLELSEDGETLFVRTGDGRLMQLDVEDFTRPDDGNDRGDRNGRGGGGLEPIPFRAELTYDTVAEREHMFEHVWRQVREKFYVEDLHGADWDFLKQEYEPLVSDLRHGRDFAELLSELLGELNASHTGGRYRPQGEGGDETASLGLLYDPNHDGPGLRVAEVLDRGPADRADSRISAGVVVTHIDGVELGDEASGVNPWSLLNHREGEKVRVALAAAPASGVDASETWEEVLEPISLRTEDELRYERWIERLREKTAELSDGRVGYVHVAGMNDRSFRRFYKDTLGPMSDKEALVIDTRWNGGGWLHDDLAAFLQGELYLTFAPRGKEPGSLDGESMMRWTRPAAVLQNEANYSDGHIGPWVIQHLGLAPLVGTPVAGTGTAVWWERLMDGETVFGIPQVGMIAPEGYYMENTQLEPDILVYNSPESVARGEDDQLKAAVELLLEELE